VAEQPYGVRIGILRQRKVENRGRRRGESIGSHDELAIPERVERFPQARQVEYESRRHDRDRRAGMAQLPKQPHDLAVYLLPRARELVAAQHDL
jgi:hypothetical protein